MRFDQIFRTVKVFAPCVSSTRVLSSIATTLEVPQTLGAVDGSCHQICVS